ncbi:hypothetical protein [Radiobacillus sp. PE A8.2]|uniref:hypothetical protein n=1 Tax=Radiobacillus sp. PE A8.2 TaxID=3380349 RepID=UPI00388FD546
MQQGASKAITPAIKAAIKDPPNNKLTSIELPPISCYCKKIFQLLLVGIIIKITAIGNFYKLKPIKRQTKRNYIEKM